jgi:hypothetical protein
LIGLGVGVDCDRPRHPQAHGAVGCSQRTAKRWGEPWSCDSPAEWQRRPEAMDVIQREEYPSVGGRSRRRAFPGLAHSGRAYTPEWEQGHWSPAAVAAHLAGDAVRRRVDSAGAISLYNRRHYIGRIHGAKSVYVMFDPEAHEWIVADEGGRQLSRQPATRISREAIIGLTVSLRDKAK